MRRFCLGAKSDSCDVQLTGDLLGVNRPLYVSQHGQLSHLFSWGR